MSAFLFSILVTLLPLVYGTVQDIWFLDSIYKVVPQVRLDPIVTPNAISPHTHRVFGSSNFGAAYNYNTYTAASCSSIGVQADKSSYWFPQLYWIDRTGNQTSYVALDENTRFYYNLLRDYDATPILAFPPGLRMVVGDPAAKSNFDGLSHQYVCQRSTDFTKNIDSINFNITMDCPGGIKTLITFPPCWDGVNLYKADNSHMAYPGSARFLGQNCPLSHPYRVPGIQVEIIFKPSNYPPAVGMPMMSTSGVSNLMWSNGDTTGYGIHGDFVNGWDMNVLTAALTDLRCVGSGTQGSTATVPMAMSDCPVLASTFDDAKARTCKMTNYPKEPYSQDDLVKIPAIPGCNLPYGNTNKPTCPTTPFTPDVTPFKGTDQSWIVDAKYRKNSTLPTTGGWQSIFCVYGDHGVFQDEISYDDQTLTPQRCGASCQASGFRFAAMTPDAKCMCGSALLGNLQNMQGQCTQPCKGDSKQMCGAGGRSSIWYAGPDIVLPTGVNHGCYVSAYDQNAGFRGAFLNITQSDKMTSAICRTTCMAGGYKFAATENDNICNCGNVWQQGPGHFVPAAQAAQNLCTAPCRGNASEICGQIWVGNFMVYDLTALTAAPVATSASIKPTTTSITVLSSTLKPNTSVTLSSSTSSKPSISVTVSASTTVKPSSVVANSSSTARPSTTTAMLVVSTSSQTSTTLASSTKPLTTSTSLPASSTTTKASTTANAAVTVTVTTTVIVSTCPTTSTVASAKAANMVALHRLPAESDDTTGTGSTNNIAKKIIYERSAHVRDHHNRRVRRK